MLKALEKKNYPSLLLFRNKTLVTQTYDLLRKCGIEGIGRVNMYGRFGDVDFSLIRWDIQGLQRTLAHYVRYTAVDFKGWRVEQI